MKFPPTVVTTFDGITSDIAKIVGVSDDHDLVEKTEADAQQQFGDHVSAHRSQPYYLDVTNPEANKGAVVDYLCKLYAIAARSHRDDRRRRERRPHVQQLGSLDRDGQRRTTA